MCNPKMQARFLAEQGTELFISCGLCVGHDTIFNANCTGPVTTIAIVIGFILPIVKSAGTLPESMRLLLTVGFLGGFTTFSSFSMETLTLIRGGSIVLAFANVAANIVLVLSAAILGLHITTLSHNY